ncbi:MAG TPA: hypothetical protein VL326_10660 [Kofleriaceae bacterium]|nr:hypothetical protein [Kofleriaceae bacterium]
MRITFVPLIAALALGGGVANAQTARDRAHMAAAQFPTSAPPAPKEEKMVPRHGQVWIAGEYEWKGGQWVWKPGHYEGRKRGKRFNRGRWEQKGDHWEWTAGIWADAPKEQEPPPALIEETPQQRRGMVWVKGYWNYQDGDYDWVAGHLEKRQRGKQWTDGHWDNVGGKWTWTAGMWADAPKTPPQPPAPLAEKPQFRRGMVWVAGHWEWQDGAYEWVPGKLEKRQRNKRWHEGAWANTGGQWTWTAGTWADAPAQQDAPPTPIVEAAQPSRKGFIWVAGNYEYRDGDYEWTPGHWEREKAGKHWVDGHWDNASGKWTWTAGAWQ